MADSKLADLTAITTTDGDEEIYVVDDPSGTPVDRKITVDDLTSGLVDRAGDAQALWLGTETEYAAIGSPAANTVYVVTPDP